MQRVGPGQASSVFTKQLVAARSIALRSIVLSGVTGSILTLGSAAARADTPLAVYFGPGLPSSTASGLRDPQFLTFGANTVSNDGTAFVQAFNYVNSTSQGLRALIYSADGTQQLGTISTGTGVLSGGLITSDDYVFAVADVTSNGTTSGTDYGTRAVRYAPGTITPVALGMPANTLNGNLGSATVYSASTGGIAGGTVSYYSGSVYKGNRGIVWNAGTTTGSLRLPATTKSDGTGLSEVFAVNKNGIAAGDAERYDASGNDLGYRPVRWAPNSTTGVELAVPTANSSGVKNGYVTALNASGVAVGKVTQFDGDNDLGERAVRWEIGGSAATPLGTLGTDINGAIAITRVPAINNAGTSIGYMTKYTNGLSVGIRAVRWDAGATAATELGNLYTGTGTGPQNVISEAYSCNNIGVTGGYSYVSSTRVHAVIWQPGSTTPLDLNSLIATGTTSTTLLEAVFGVSDTGWVAGLSLYDPDGAGSAPAYTRAFSMLVPQAGTYGQGDADFDTDIDFNDLLVLAKHYNLPSGGSIASADFNLDGLTDFNDLLALAKHYNTSAAGLAAATSDAFASDFDLARSLVPEPTALSALLAAGLLRRRR